ncbi:MAG: DUF512 domain-containing protein [Oscillospiraceae bacterium]|nr:DUF512 domain-containing protein [Oscillospiraceae bacterium]
MPVNIKNVLPGSPAERAGYRVGMTLNSINGHEINDVLDYMFYADEDFGLEFETFLMDNKRNCGNNCIFCFIDQLPQGLRESLYFKDDDSRLSFLQGNYITLTNLSEGDVGRIISMRTPVNVSVHTVNPELRSFMMGNPKAGEALSTLYRFAEAGISMNCQLVLCPGINDGEELIRSLDVLTGYPSIESIACVPVGLTKFRDNLPKLRCFNKEEAAKIIRVTEKYERVFAADEFYLTAEKPLPDYEYYGSFPQYENGVGMWAYFDNAQCTMHNAQLRRISIATGVAAYPLIKRVFGGAARVYAVRNEFFGESVTVSGLLTGIDIINQLKREDLGEELWLPPNMFNTDGLTLDSMTVEDISQALNVKTVILDPA